MAKKKTVAKVKAKAKKKPASRPKTVKQPVVKSAKQKFSKKVKKSAPQSAPVSNRPENDNGKSGKTFDTLRGMKDILPEKSPMWLWIQHTAEHISKAYGFTYIETPVLEPVNLFVRSLGKSTDVVDKEMYVFEDKDGSKVALRPEATASIARAYINHGMHNRPQPVKVWYWGQMFRHDRPQAGRYRQFHQFGCESLGQRDPVIDAELIAVSYNFLLDLGIMTEVHINSIGSSEDRKNYIVELVGYLRTKRTYLCADCKRRIVKNPLRVLDCKEQECQTVVEEAPQIIDWLSQDSKSFFMKVIEYLDELQVPYVLRSTLVRGLDYYTDTVFEFYTEKGEESAQSALGGGGRYDGLVEQLGGRPTPAAGFSMGIERIVAELGRLKGSDQEIKNPYDGTMRIFFAQLGEQARRRVLRLIEELRRKGILVGSNLAKTSLKAQLELANGMKATHSVILGQKEVQDGTVIIRDMSSGIQEIVDQKKIEQELRKIINS